MPLTRNVTLSCDSIGAIAACLLRSIDESLDDLKRDPQFTANRENIERKLVALAELDLADGKEALRLRARFAEIKETDDE